MKALGNKKGFDTTWKQNELRMALRCGLNVVVKEERLKTWRRPSGKIAHLHYDDGRLVALTMCTYRLAGWEEFIMNETAALPLKAEHERLFEAAAFGRLSLWPHVTATLRLMRLHFSSPTTGSLKKYFLLRVLWGPAIGSQTDHLRTKVIARSRLGTAAIEQPKLSSGQGWVGGDEAL